MTDGWRNRFMAPVYAFALSLAFVFSLGFALDDPTRIRLTIAGQNELPGEFRDLQVRVKPAGGERQLDEGPLNRSGEFTLLNPHETIRICTKLPGGWFAVGAVIEANGDSCLDYTAPGKDIEIMLRKG